MRTPIVIKYKNPQSLVNGNLAYNGLLITAGKHMANAIFASGVSAQVIEMNMVMRILLPEWYESTRKLEQYILLDEIIAGLEAADKNGKINNALQAMHRNKSEIIKSISVLVEIGVEPRLLPSDSMEQKIFKRIYQEFIEDSRSGVLDLERRLVRWQKTSPFKEELSTNVMRTTGKAIGVPKAVYFQGFYYITPLQSRLINAFRRLSIPVYFLNNVDDREPVFYEIWNRNPYFQEKMLVRLLDDLPEGKKVKKRSLVKYEDTFSMVWRLKTVNANETSIYAVMSAQVRKIMENFFPATEEKSHLLTYPVGRYLFSLYSMWDDENGLVLEPDNVRICLASGWAGSKYEENEMVLQTYDTIYDYFRRCRTVGDWRHTMDRLLEVRKKLLPLFKKNNGEALGKWQEIITNPFHNLGAFSVDEKKLAKVMEAIRNMAEDALNLFGGEDTLDLREHFRTVYKMLREKAPKGLLKKEEEAVLSIMLSRLQNSPGRISTCRSSGLAEAMCFFLGGKLDEDMLNTEDEVFGPVRGLSNIESEYVLPRGKKFMICCCDSKNMPGKAADYPWPLTSAYIDALDCKGEAEMCRRNYLHCMENVCLSNRYLFHLADQLDNVEFSWIGTLDGKECNPSVYLLQLKDKYNLSIREENHLLRNGMMNIGSMEGDWKLHKQAVTKFMEEDSIHPAEIEMDRAFCPHKEWRLLYDYILTEHPVFSSNFHLQFYASIMIALLADAASTSYESAAAQFFAIYPAFVEVERQEILDFAKRLKTNELSKERTALADGEYTLKRHYLQYLSIKMVNDYLNYGHLPENYEKNMCKYCSHGNYCFIRREV